VKVNLINMHLSYMELLQYKYSILCIVVNSTSYVGWLFHYSLLLHIAEPFVIDGAYPVQFLVGFRTSQVLIPVFPATLRRGIDGNFDITLETVDDNVIIGSPSQAVVKVPSPFA